MRSLILEATFPWFNETSYLWVLSVRRWQVLHAANGSEIEVLGETEVTMNVADLELPCDCLVVRDVSDVILGLDWMTKHVDTLNLKNKSIIVQGRTLPLVKHPKERSGRTLVCDRSVTTPPPTEAKSETERRFAAGYLDAW